VPSRIRRTLERHGTAIAAGLIGIAIGFAGRALLSSDTKVDLAVVAVFGAVGLAVLRELAESSLRSLLTRVLRLALGRYPGHRRLERERFGQTRVSDYVPGEGFEREKWVDLSLLDHRGYAYGVARSPDYIPLYGNGVARIGEIRLICAPAAAPLPARAAGLIDEQILSLVEENARCNRPFSDTPLVRLLSWSPPVEQQGPLQLHAETVGHQRYAAVVRLLREDSPSGLLRRSYEIKPRELDNPMVCGCLGVEVAVVTSDGQLVLAHRGDLASDYRNQIVVSIGRGIHPTIDTHPDDPSMLDPYLTVQRGAMDELGIEVDGRRTRFLALGLETTRMDPDLLGYIEVEQTFADIEAAYLAARARDRWESTTLSAIAFTPNSVADLLASEQSLTPPTPMNLVFAISDRFGERECERAMTRRGR
jgi:hypothetical protein